MKQKPRKPLLIGRPSREIDYNLPAPDDDANFRPIDPETRLWRGVVAACVTDALISSDGFLGSTEGQKTHPETVGPRVREEARRWLIADSGPWRQARESICAMADLCPARLRALALALIAAQARGEDVRRALRRNARNTMNNGAFDLSA